MATQYTPDTSDDDATYCRHNGHYCPGCSCECHTSPTPDPQDHAARGLPPIAGGSGEASPYQCDRCQAIAWGAVIVQCRHCTRRYCASYCLDYHRARPERCTPPIAGGSGEPEPPTTVIYRRWPNGDIIALFPDLPGIYPYITSYQHFGQHGDADYGHVIASTRPVKPADATELAAELASIGYDLRPRMRRQYG